MRAQICFCLNMANVTEYQHEWMLTRLHTIHKMESFLTIDGGVELFFDTYDYYKEQSKDTFICPFCNGIIVDLLRRNRLFHQFYVPSKNYRPDFVARKNSVQGFPCTCGHTVDLNKADDQWVLIPQRGSELTHVSLAFEEQASVDEYYRRLYAVGKWVIDCPRCQGLTLMECDNSGTAISAEYYTKKIVRKGQEIDLRRLEP